MNKDINLVETDSPDVAEVAKDTLITLLDKIQYVEPEHICEYAQAIVLITSIYDVQKDKSFPSDINPFKDLFHS